MATGKKKVIVYTDWIIQFESLTDEEAGKLIKHFFKYVNDLSPESDRLTELLFNPIKSTLKRDLEQWEKKQEINRENGLKGGRPKKETETQNNPVGFLKTQHNPKKGVSVNDSVNDINNITESPKVDSINFDILLQFINETLGKKYSVISTKAKTSFKARLRDGYTKEQIMIAIKNVKNDTYHKETNYKYATVEYFSRAKTLDMHGQVVKQSSFNPHKMILDHD